MTKETFSDGLSERTELTKAQVSCVVDTFDTFDQDAINDLYTSSDRKDLGDKDEQQFEKIVEDCVDGLTAGWQSTGWCCGALRATPIRNTRVGAGGFAGSTGSPVWWR